MTQINSMSGYAVRIDWPATGAGGLCAEAEVVRHEFTQFTASLPRALRRVAGTSRYWSRSPIRPLAVTVVPIERAAFVAHAAGCGSRQCPTTAPLFGMSQADARPTPGR